MTKARTFANVWEAIEDSPEEAATMTMRSNVMSAIKEKVHGWNITQARAARRSPQLQHEAKLSGRGSPLAPSLGYYERSMVCLPAVDVPGCGSRQPHAIPVSSREQRDDEVCQMILPDHLAYVSSLLSKHGWLAGDQLTYTDLAADGRGN